MKQVAALEQFNPDPARRANMPLTWLPMQGYHVPSRNSNAAAHSATYSTTVVAQQGKRNTLRAVKKGKNKTENACYLRRLTLLLVGVFCSLTLSRVRPLSSRACMRDMSTCPSSLVRPALCASRRLSSRDLSSPSVCPTTDSSDKFEVGRGSKHSVRVKDKTKWLRSPTRTHINERTADGPSGRSANGTTKQTNERPTDRAISR